MSPEIICSILIAVLAVMSVITFAAYGFDKRKAVKGRWRIPESRLLLLSFFGGAPGAVLGMHFFHHKTKKLRFRILVPLFLILQIILLVFAGYCADYYHADESAAAALMSDDSVEVMERGQYWKFDGPAEDDAYIFYPGGKVEAAAYAPLMHRLADAGVDAYLVKMPFNLAFFGMNRADGIMKAGSYANWYIGGHSLGGVAAAGYATEHEAQLDGLILLASYPAKEIDDSLDGLMIRGSEDGVLNLDAAAKAWDLWNGAEYILDGGNHAGFGSYGPQKGDGAAGISADQQQADTAAAILEFIEK